MRGVSEACGAFRLGPELTQRPGERSNPLPVASEREAARGFSQGQQPVYRLVYSAQLQRWTARQLEAVARGTIIAPISAA